MMGFARFLFVSAFAISLPLQAAVQKVDNFVLLDHTGAAQELYYDKEAEAIVLIVQGNGCQIIRSLTPDFQALQKDYEKKGVRMFMLNSNLQDTRASIAKEAEEWNLGMPVLHDTAQVIGRSLNLTRTGEVIVIDPASQQIVYRGALNDRVDYERQKKGASETYVRDVLDDMLKGRDVAYREVNGDEAPETILAGWTYCDEDVGRAEEMARKYIGGYYQTVVEHYELAGSHMKNTKGYEAYVSVQENVQKSQDAMEEFFMSIQVWGTPEMCYDKIKAFTGRVNAGAFNGVFSYAGMPYEAAEQSMTLFAREVMPEIRKLPGQPLISSAA